MKFRNAKFNELGSIDCEIEHPVYGWIPFTADPKDIEPIGKKVFDVACKQAAPYAKPSLNIEAVSRDARAKRNELLYESDWTQLPDVPQETKTTWAVYRQLLRDLTTQPGFPLDVIWPEKPK